jgi:hypothetical protein
MQRVVGVPGIPWPDPCRRFCVFQCCPLGVAGCRRPRQYQRSDGAGTVRSSWCRVIGAGPIHAGWAGGTAQQRIDWQNEIDGALETYNLFASISSGAFLSYNGAGATMRTVNNANISCPNANWNGTSANFCSNVTSDDVVTHEWGHAYTEFTNNLIYQWQSGALNESYSDIWGETVDLLNARQTDVPAGIRRNMHCSSLGRNFPGAPEEASLRWQMGEDSTAFGTPIRDMWYPECANDPGSVASPAYHCLLHDSGGVHSNSGVPNRAFALMVDGDPALGSDACNGDIGWYLDDIRVCDCEGSTDGIFKHGFE